MSQPIYVKLSIDETAYYSGNTYYEEVFVPYDIWEEIKDRVEMHTYLHELDGKHSETKAEIDVEDMYEKELKSYQPSQLNDSEHLLWHVFEYFPEQYDSSFIEKVQEEVAALCEVVTLTVTVDAKKKDEVLKLIEPYRI